MTRLGGHLVSFWVALAASYPCTACQQAPKQQEAGAASAVASSAASRLELTRSSYDLGSVVQDETVRRTIFVENAGSAPLEIYGVEPSRFCAGSIEPRTIGPGNRGQLHITCRADLAGALRERLQVKSNDPRRGQGKLELVAQVTPLLAFDPPSVNLGMAFGEQRSQKVRLVGALAGQARPRLKSSPIADVEIETLSEPAGVTGGYRIRCQGRKVGMHAASLIVETGLKHPKQVSLPYACRVKGTLEVSPTNPYFNLKLPGPKVVRIEVKSSQPGFRVLATQIAEGPFAASFEQRDKRDFVVKVTVLEARIGERERGVTGRLIILSNDRTEPRKELRLFGLGRVHRMQGQ